MMTAWVAHALATSSRATTYDTAPAPLPPHCSGITMPMRPSSPMPLTVSCGKRASRSMSAAIGLMWASANSRTVAWIICCSEVKSSRIFWEKGAAGVRDAYTLRPPLDSPLLVQELLELFRELRHDLEEVGDDPEVGDLEDRRLRVLVHGDDDFRGPHPRQVLNRARDAEAEIELRRDGPAGLADLEPVRPPAGVDGGPRGAHRGADHAAQLFEDHVVLRPLHPAPARDDRLRLGQLRQAGGDLLAALDELHLGAGHRHGRSFDRRRLSGLGVRRAEHVRSERRDPRRLGPRHLREKLARVDRAGRHQGVPIEREPDRVA